MAEPTWFQRYPSPSYGKKLLLIPVTHTRRRSRKINTLRGLERISGSLRTWKISARGPSISTIVWRTHHALVDGFSAALLYAKLRDVLEGLPIKAGTPFTEVAAGLNKLQQSTRMASKGFWEKSCPQNSGAPSKLLLPPSKSEGSLTRKIKTLTLKAPIAELLARAR